MNILIAGFPYIRSSYRDTFKAYPKGDQIFFLLPSRWPIKNGAVIFDAPNEPNVIKAKAYFSHSNYPIVGGLFKGWMPSFPLVLIKLRKQNRIHLVYSCGEPVLLTTLYQALWSKIVGRKHVFFSWENIQYERKFSGINLWVKKIIIKLNIALSDGIICGNKKGENIYRKYTNKKISVIPMSGADAELFQKVSLAKEFKGNNLEDKVVFTFAGAIGYRKGLTYLLEAFGELAKKEPNTFLVIAGSGEYDNEVEGIINRKGISDYVLRIPWLDRPDLKKLLNVSDVFVYPSISHGGWEEQFGYSMAEASLMELPVIATTSGSISDVVVPEHTGILVPEKDSGALSQAMLRLCIDKELREKLGKNGREYIVSHYSHEMVAGQFHDFFRTII